MNRTLRLFYYIAVPLTVLILGGSIAALIARFNYHKKINRKEFIDIASSSVDEAYRLIELTEWYTKLSTFLLVITSILALSIAVVRLWRPIQALLTKRMDK